MPAHAKLSPSGSKRWFACAGSIVLEEAIPDTHNEYSDDGTAMHDIAARCLTEHYRATRYIGELVPVHHGDEEPRYVEIDDYMADLVQGYVDTMRRIAIGHAYWVEERVEFSDFLDPAVLQHLGPQFGTLDFSVILPIEGSNFFELNIDDLKTGHTPVSPVKNSQGMLYALGKLYKLMSDDLDTTITDPFEYAHEVLHISQVRIGIYQPKVYSHGLEEWTCSLEDLERFATLARSKAMSVRVAKETYGTIPMEDWDRTFLNQTPNEVDCAFCRAMATCPSAQRAVMAGIEDFPIINEQDMSSMIHNGTDSAKLAELMTLAPFAEDFFTAVRAEIERRLMLAQPVPGFGLELGRQGPRKWKDVKDAEEMVRKQFRLKIEDAYNMKLKSPTQIEEMTKGAEPVVGPRQWKKLQEEITRSDPKPSVKPAAVIKKPYVPEQLKTDDFAPVEDDGQLW